MPGTRYGGHRCSAQFVASGTFRLWPYDSSTWVNFKFGFWLFFNNRINYASGSLAFNRPVKEPAKQPGTNVGVQHRLPETGDESAKRNVETPTKNFKIQEVK